MGNIKSFMVVIVSLFGAGTVGVVNAQAQTLPEQVLPIQTDNLWHLQEREGSVNGLSGNDFLILNTNLDTRLEMNDGIETRNLLLNQSSEAVQQGVVTLDGVRTVSNQSNINFDQQIQVGLDRQNINVGDIQENNPPLILNRQNLTTNQYQEGGGEAVMINRTGFSVEGNVSRQTMQHQSKAIVNGIGFIEQRSEGGNNTQRDTTVNIPNLTLPTLPQAQ